MKIKIFLNPPNISQHAKVWGLICLNYEHLPKFKDTKHTLNSSLNPQFIETAVRR